MKRVILMAVALCVAAPALAQTTVTTTTGATGFYVVRDVKTKKCTVVDKKPTTTTEVTVVGDTVYKTRTEAEAGVTKVCTTN